ncbi:MAG: YggS family pyridoxal phosphate-dependent enzyme [Bdellovibrionota bacterium]
MSQLYDRWSLIVDRVGQACARSNRSAGEVRVVAVSKHQSMESIEQAITLGIRDFGENYVQEALPKIQALEQLDLRWHFIGHLQSNKAKQIGQHFSTVHSLDRISTAKELSKAKSSVSCLVQLNLSGERTKDGVDAAGLEPLLAELDDIHGLHVEGLMTFPPFQNDPEDNRRYFRQARKLWEAMKAKSWKQISMKELSMGVSNDYEVAIEEGATLVRIGTSLFGPR